MWRATHLMGHTGARHGAGQAQLRLAQQIKPRRQMAGDRHARVIANDMPIALCHIAPHYTLYRLISLPCPLAKDHLH
jgi:hypothetical protein